jgi:hypothetical protein
LIESKPWVSGMTVPIHGTWRVLSRLISRLSMCMICRCGVAIRSAAFARDALRPSRRSHIYSYCICSLFTHIVLSYSLPLVSPHDTPTVVSINVNQSLPRYPTLPLSESAPCGVRSVAAWRRYSSPISLSAPATYERETPSW